MKSIKGEGSATCHTCGESFDAEFWSLIRGDVDAELKESLLGGELNLVSCPACGAFFYHDRNIIYFDPASELLAFVAPACAQKDFPAQKAKMQQDFELLKANLKSMAITYAPFYLCGLEELKAMLEYDDKVSSESEVVAALGAQKGYKIALLKRAYARLKGWPYYVPVCEGDYSKETLLKAGKETLAANASLHLLAAFIKDIAAGAPLPPHL